MTLYVDSSAIDNRRRAFADDLDGFALVNLDAQTCHEASRIAEETLCRSIDDYVIAATAEVHEAHLATLNLKHFPMFKGLRRPW